MASANVADWDADKYSKDAKFAFEGAVPLVDLLNPRPGERILDLGCGSGELTMVLKDAGSEVVGVDGSPSMVEASKAKGLDAHLCDGHDLNFKEEFDAVFSNMALHWMKKDPRQVVKSIYNALKKNGRFVTEFGGKGNMNRVLSTLKSVLKNHGISFDQLNPFYFPSSEEYAALLAAEGMQIQSIETFPRKTPIPAGLVGWLELFGHDFFVDLNESEKQKICKEVESAMQPLEVDQNGVYLGDFVGLRLVASRINND